MNLCILILTKNEEQHIERAIRSVGDIATRVVVVDSHSTDRTCEIAESLGATVLKNDWVNYATQFNWGLGQLGPETEWVFRLDADEIVSQPLSDEIKALTADTLARLSGLYIGRRMTFLGSPIKFGGVFPVQVLRLFRHGQGACENRWMDEHIIVEGETVKLKGEILDDNKNSLTWWIDKHNHYANREAVDLLNLEYGFAPMQSVARMKGGGQDGFKRWLKESVYMRLPTGLRAWSYFGYRYILRLGFLDGKSGAAFHFLQGFWYRYLVDIKMFEVREHMQSNECSITESIKNVLGINIPYEENIHEGPEVRTR